MTSGSRASSTRASGWHRESIKAAIRMRGLSCAELARRGGYEASAIHRCLRGQRWSHVESLIADFLGVAPHKLWPDRWTRKGPRYRAQAQRIAPRERAR